jgi:excisionase family DNA binding protein
MSVERELMTSPVPNAYLTVQEIARHLRVSKMTVYRLIHAGDIPSVQVGRSYRVHRNAVAHYVKSGENAA